MFSSILEIIRKSSQLLALGTKVLGLTAFAAILFSANVAFGTPTQLAMTGQQYFADGRNSLL